MNLKVLLAGFLIIGILLLGIGIYLVYKVNNPSPVITQSTNTSVQVVETPQSSIISKTITVPATVVWKDTGIDVTGKTVTIKRVSGLWNNVDDIYDQNGEGVGNYPGTIMPGAKIGELIAKTDSGMARIGTQNTITGKGRLFLGINDIPGKYDDNHGELVVEVTFVEITPTPITKSLTIPSTTMWYDTGIDIPSNSSVLIKYISGQWSNTNGEGNIWTDGAGSGSWEGLVVPNAPLRSLVAKTKSGTYYIGNSFQGSLGGGRLYLGMNDVVNKYSDNMGELQVSVTIK